MDMAYDIIYQCYLVQFSKCHAYYTQNGMPNTDGGE